MPFDLKEANQLSNFIFGVQRMNKSSLFCLSMKTAGYRFQSAANLFLRAKLLKSLEGLSLIFLVGIEVQEVNFATKKSFMPFGLHLPFQISK